MRTIIFILLMQALTVHSSTAQDHAPEILLRMQGCYQLRQTPLVSTLQYGPSLCIGKKWGRLSSFLSTSFHNFSGVSINMKYAYRISYSCELYFHLQKFPKWSIVGTYSYNHYKSQLNTYSINGYSYEQPAITWHFLAPGIGLSLKSNRGFEFRALLVNEGWKNITSINDSPYAMIDLSYSLIHKKKVI